MQLGLMTLGNPDWDLETFLANASKWGFHGLDLRGIGPELDITRLPKFTTDAQATSNLLGSTGLQIAAISSSLQLCDSQRFEDNLTEARRTIEVAKAFGVSYIRVFGGGPEDLSEAVHIGRTTAQALAELPGAQDLEWVVETHDRWTNPADLAVLLPQLPGCFAALWDLAHPARMHGIPPKEVWAAIGPWVRYTHVKDVKRSGESWSYVAVGEGDLPIAESVRLLHENGYDGWLTFEHEKRWIPSLPSLEEVGPKFVQWARGLGVVA